MSHNKSTISKKKSILDTIPENLPSLDRAKKITEKAIENGFKWDNIFQVLNKVREELNEIEECLGQNQHDSIKEELGDFILATVALCIYLKEDPTESLNRGIEKFEKRFRKFEEILEKQNKNLKNSNLKEILEAWTVAKTNIAFEEKM